LEEYARLEKPLNLILTDMLLPDGTGLEIVSAVKSHPVWRLTPVVVLSNEKSDDLISDAYAMGANCFLPKTPKTGSVIKMLQSLYDCWLDSSVLPKVSYAENSLQAILSKWIRHRARQANVYMSLSQALSEDISLSDFFLNRALNEGNFTNMAIFFQRIIKEADMPPDIAERFVQMQARIDAALRNAELFLKDNPEPTVAESLPIILDNLEAVDERTLSEFIHQVLHKNPVAAKAFRSALLDHFAKMASFIADTADLPDLKQRAIDFGRMAFKN
jgi:CheY-like chemotaxis protein